MTSSGNSTDRKIARQVLTQTLHVRPGENVTIESWSESVPWAVPFVLEARRLGAHPIMLYEDEETFWESLKSGHSQSTGVVGEHEWKAVEASDAYVFFFGPSDWTRFDSLSDRQTAGVAAYNGEWYRRAAKAKLRGARMYIGRTSPATARRWHVDLASWREALARASLASPAAMARLAKKVAERLRKGKEVRVVHRNGTDLSFRLGGFPVQVDDAVVDAEDVKSGNNIASIPGGVVGVATDHLSARGVLVGNHPVYPNSGPASGIRWEFSDGRLSSHAYRQGSAAFEKAYGEAPRKGRDRLSYFSVGLNPSLSGCPQMEDQELGALMFRLGGNSFAGGTNRNPFVSWMVVDGASVSVDGRPLVAGGRVL